jgi:hypothetical protein
MKALWLLCAVTLSGCASDSLYFGTYTRVGIDASSDGAGIGAKNAALNIAPPKKDGSAFDVLGTSDLDLSYNNALIHEVFAVGDAAICASYTSKAAYVAGEKRQPNVSQKGAPGALIFGSYTSWSLLDLSWGSATGTGINFGYKRGVGVKLPIVKDQVGPVFASVWINTLKSTDSPAGAPQSATKGSRSVYVFATGYAAVIKASEGAAQLNGNDPAYANAGCLK